jgi:hypothetical protein
VVPFREGVVVRDAAAQRCDTTQTLSTVAGIVFVRGVDNVC